MILLNNLGLILVLFGPIKFPASENILSEPDAAGTGRYLCANLLKKCQDSSIIVLNKMAICVIEIY